MYTNNRNKSEMFLSEKQVSRVGEKSKQTRWLTSNVQHSTLLHLYFTFDYGKIFHI